MERQSDDDLGEFAWRIILTEGLSRPAPRLERDPELLISGMDEEVVEESCEEGEK